MKKKEIIEHLRTRVAELTMVKLENQMLRKTLYSQEEEIRDLTTLLSDAKEKVNQLNKALYFKEVYEPKGE